MHTQLAIVGAGPGGYAAAFLAADLGMQVTLVEMDARLGGCCLLRGCIPSKALLHVAKTMADAKHLAAWGVTYTDPAVDLDAVRAQKDKVIQTLAAGLKQLSTKRNIHVIHARATFEDSQTLRLLPSAVGMGQEAVGRGQGPGVRGQGSGVRGSESGVGIQHSPSTLHPQPSTLHYDHCILATGSRPTTIPTLDLPSGRVMDSTAALDLPDVPGSMLVVGGGYIGLELGTVYAALGTHVSVVELTDGLLPGVDRDLLGPLQKRLQSAFQAIYLSSQVTALADKQDQIEVTFASEAPPPAERFDRVLICVGRRPNTENLGLENTKVELDRRGFIMVDNQQHTTDPHILAVGDVAGQPLLAHKASHQAKVAVEALLGQPAAFEPRAIPAVVFTDPEIAWAGLTEIEVQQQGRRVQVARFPWAASGRAQTLGWTEGLTKWLIDPETERLLGCGIVGPGAGELIAEAVLAIELGASARELSHSIHPHPTLSETLAHAAEVHLGTATDLYRPKRTRP
jgi:dihydrolipoamide dehydrogenase